MGVGWGRVFGDSWVMPVDKAYKRVSIMYSTLDTSHASILVGASSKPGRRLHSSITPALNRPGPAKRLHRPTGSSHSTPVRGEPDAHPIRPTGTRPRSPDSQASTSMTAVVASRSSGWTGGSIRSRIWTESHFGTGRCSCHRLPAAPTGSASPTLSTSPHASSRTGARRRRGTLLALSRPEMQGQRLSSFYWT